MLAADEDILRVHSKCHLNSIRESSKAGGGRIKVDTLMSAESSEVAILAAGASKVAKYPQVDAAFLAESFQSTAVWRARMVAGADS